jgi:hypothetical protein
MAIVLDGTNGINTPDLESAGPVSGTTGTFSGAVTAASVQAGGVATNIYPLVSATAVTASGTSVDFTGIPSWAKRITVMLSGVSTSGTSIIQIQLGDAGGVENTGYLAQTWSAGVNTAVITSGVYLSTGNVATHIWLAQVVISNISANSWVMSGISNITNAANVGIQLLGSKTLSDVLTQVRITTVNGTDTFDAGSINIMYE